MRILVGFLLLLAPIVAISQALNSGNWRGAIHYEQAEVPFAFDITETAGEYYFSLTNGPEDIVKSKINFKNDTLQIPLGAFDAVLKASFTVSSMSGVWMKGYKDSPIPFSAEFDQPVFPDGRGDIDIETPWAITFEQSEFNAYAGIALFSQNNHNLSGTIMTETSDLRYFDGVLLKDSLVLSSFDGAHAFLFVGSKLKDQWQGVIHLDDNYSEKWTATADEDAKLPDPWEVVEVEPNTHRPYFDILAAADDKQIDESKYFNKVLVIQLFGTWCPNSLDQTNYLIDWYKNEKPDGVEVLAVAFEPYDRQRSKDRIDEYRSHLNVPYEVLLGGSLSKGQAAVAFPFMEKITAFPTLVIVDKLGYVRYVNSYFNGPATGKYYREFRQSFEKKIASLLEE